LARKKLSYREKIEQIGNKLTNLALKLEKQAEEGGGKISSNMGNTIANCLKSSADVFKYLDGVDASVDISVDMKCGLSKKDKERLDEICKLLKVEEAEP
jgi:hypothetical protein